MALLQLREASKEYPEQVIFHNISLQIQKKDRVGLIGVNGTGKSTLIKILIGNEFLDKGEILKSNDLEIGYLAQKNDLDLDSTLYQEMLSIYQNLFVLEEKLKKLEEKMSDFSGEELEKVMQCYSKLREEFEEKEGYQYESRIKGVLKGLGFKENEFKDNLINFSGGEKTRAVLAKLLLKQPNLLLLDEPTNHLDLQAKEWLEDYLNTYPGAIVIISHDRHFLDKTVDRLWELEKGRLEKYSGNYSFYLNEKPRKLLTWQREYEKQQEKIKKLEKYIRKNKAGVDAKQARGRQKKLDRMEEIPPPPKLENPSIKFRLDTISGEDVLKVKNLTKFYEENLLFKDINFKLYRGEKIALVGSNGSGKSTIFKILMEKEVADDGEISSGTRVKMGYYDQEHKSLTPEYNLVEEIQKIDGVTRTEARDILAKFLFKGDDVLRKISTLSGGEKARVSLAKLALEDYNLLLLDEPTNHLDIKAKEILEEALKDYEGTILVISHDRYFLDKLVDKVFALQGKKLLTYKGDYSVYRQEYKESLLLKEKNNEENKNSSENTKKGKNNKQGKEVNLEELELEIIELEKRIEELESEFNKEELYDDSEKLANLSKEYEALKQKLNEHYKLWENVV
jgi:ATP-binding cassette subfamily F protein 3